MPKIIRGSRDAKGNVTLRGSNVGKVFCPTCRGECATVLEDGKQMMQCSRCPTKFRAVRLA